MFIRFEVSTILDQLKSPAFCGKAFRVLFFAKLQSTWMHHDINIASPNDCVGAEWIDENVEMGDFKRIFTFLSFPHQLNQFLPWQFFHSPSALLESIVQTRKQTHISPLPSFASKAVHVVWKHFWIYWGRTCSTWAHTDESGSFDVLQNAWKKNQRCWVQQSRHSMMAIQWWSVKTL